MAKSTSLIQTKNYSTLSDNNTARAWMIFSLAFFTGTEWKNNSILQYWNGVQCSNVWAKAIGSKWMNRHGNRQQQIKSRTTTTTAAAKRTGHWTVFSPNIVNDRIDEYTFMNNRSSISQNPGISIWNIAERIIVASRA